MYGTVKGVRWYVLTPAEEADLLKTRSLSPAQLACERLRIFVRFDTVADAFRAAEKLTDVKNPSRWSVAFFSSELYSRGVLGLGEDAVSQANES
ncbi:unnamed protein product [Phytomonas sp. EM1]|nr:unnamed protein product [Phytomonas sp. EM1]|eukprot:CCW64281.1 unnamed protein product [Phytomonas sp. isolate EM1]